MSDELASRQRHGQSLYRQHDYRGALAIFDNLISETYDPPLSLLDNRAATLTKLGDLPKALKDGKKMIGLGKDEATGYLRTGQILRLMSKEQTALDIYKYGLKHIPSESDNASLLRNMRDRLVKQLAEPNSVDMLQVLPLELIDSILGYLSWNTVQTLTRVSKSWRSLIIGISSVWKHIDLSGAKRNVPLRSIKEYIQRGERRTTQVTLRKADPGDRDLFKIIVNRCPRLQSLWLIDGRSSASLQVLEKASTLTSLKIGPHRSINIHVLCRLMNQCSGLTTVDCNVTSNREPPQWKGNFPGLTTLAFRYWGSQVDLLPKVIHLRQLTIACHTSDSDDDLVASLLSNLKSLQVLDIDGQNHHEHFERYPEPLTELSFNEGLFIVKDANVTPGRFVHLKSLSIGTLRLESLDCLGTFFDAFNNLEVLKIETIGMNDWEVPDHEALTRAFATINLESLKSLSFGSVYVKDSLLEHWANTCPNLTRIDISQCPGITGVGIKHLCLKKGSKLEYLDVKGSANISYDAIEWARGLGIEVLWGATSRKGGRKVRY